MAATEHTNKPSNSWASVLLLPKTLWGFMVVSCVSMLSYALYTEKYQGLIPCALCMTQRAFYLMLALTAIAALIHRPGKIGTRVYAAFAIVWADLGALTAGRQVWLQHLPDDQVPACGPSLGYMLETLPIAETFKTLMMGDGNCAEVQWTFMGLSMPEWSLVWFISFGLIAVYLLITAKDKPVTKQEPTIGQP